MTTLDDCRQMRLQEVLTPQRIRCGILLNSKKQLLQTLADLLSVERPELDPNAVLNCLLERERVSNTGLGNGVALPHGRLAKLHQPLAGFIHMSKGIDYGAPDHKPVDLVYAMIVPLETDGHYLECLSQLGALLQDSKFSAQLRHQVHTKDVYALLTDAAHAAAKSSTPETIG